MKKLYDINFDSDEYILYLLIQVLMTNYGSLFFLYLNPISVMT